MGVDLLKGFDKDGDEDGDFGGVVENEKLEIEHKDNVIDCNLAHIFIIPLL